MKKTLFNLILFLCSYSAIAQNQNSNWIFGDSAGISFNNINNPIPIFSSMDGRGSCSSIADTLGNLLFYAFTRDGINFDNTTIVYNKNHQMMQNGDSIVGEAWYNELAIIPFGDSTNRYYLFSIAISNLTSVGLYYSIIDMDSNSGLGSVTQKNIQLLNIRMTDCVQAVRHGNGKDWWFIAKQSGLGSTSYNRFYVYLVSSSGISNPIIVSLGGSTDGDFQKFIINNSANKIMLMNFSGFMCQYNFDRCTGVISNPDIIYQEQSFNYSRFFWEGAYSPNDSLFYATSCWRYYPQDTSRLLQFDLFAPNITASCDTLLEWRNPLLPGAVRRAPDNKLYMTTWYNWGFPAYPYPDSVYNQYNMSLSVINYPDSLGAACDFQPFSFYLGGKRTYAGLPNNPNYSLGALVGSLCDTITNLTPTPEGGVNATLQGTYISAWQKLFVNAQHLKGTNGVLTIFDLNGRNVFSSSTKTRPPYFTMDIDCSSFSNGLYLINLTTEKEKLSCKFVKN